MNLSDVNWMLSAAVQSGAALVAIVGGLLGSRYVSLDAEQQSARRRAKDIEARLAAAVLRANAASDSLTDYQVRSLLDRDACYELILESGGDVRIADVLDALDLDESDTPIEALQQYLDTLSVEMEAALKDLNGIVPDSAHPPAWDIFRRENALKVNNGPLWEWVYVEIAKGRREKARSRMVARGPILSLSVDSMMGAIDFAPINPSHVGQQIASEGRRIEEARDADREVLRLEAERDAAQNHLGDVTQPEGFNLALQVLAYISVTAIGIPLGLMVASPLTLSIWIRVVIAVLFLSGVALLLRFLAVYARHLLRSSVSKSLPRDLWGLLRRGA